MATSGTSPQVLYAEGSTVTEPIEPIVDVVKFGGCFMVTAISRISNKIFRRTLIPMAFADDDDIEESIVEHRDQIRTLEECADRWLHHDSRYRRCLKFVEDAVTVDVAGDGFLDAGYSFVELEMDGEPKLTVVRCGIHTSQTKVVRYSVIPIKPGEVNIWKEEVL